MENALMNKVNRVSRRLAMILWVGAAIGTVFGIAVTLAALFRAELLRGWANEAYPLAEGLTHPQIFMLVVLGLGQLALTVAALCALARMFSSVAREEPLNLEASTLMRRASGWLLAATIYAVAVQIPGSLVASVHMPEGSRFISLALSSSHASGVIAALVLFAVASIQELAAQVRDDNRQII
ncbi:MAG: DUF2975 domain-containing protein [Hoeflea sp.]|uniref:DUF2975 domain-containing protein n=1 Tax=Hoeflea sp. TaxID=1940281 RepID=UPI0032EF95F0